MEFRIHNDIIYLQLSIRGRGDIHVRRLLKTGFTFKKYRELLGSALCVFNSNNSFIIENILRSDDCGEYNWYKLMD